MNTGIRGDAAVLLTSSKLIEAGIGLLKPISESLAFDLVAYDGNNFDRIQVKRAYPIESSKFRVSLRRVSMTAKGAVARKYSENDAEFVIAVVMETGDLYCFPINVAGNRNSITLNPNNIETKYITNPKSTNAEVYKNTINLHDRVYKL